MTMKKFKKHQIIKTKRGYFQCVCVDNDIAIFAPTFPEEKRTVYKRMFAVESKYKKRCTGGYETANGGFKFESN